MELTHNFTSTVPYTMDNGKSGECIVLWDLKIEIDEDGIRHIKPIIRELRGDILKRASFKDVVASYESHDGQGVVFYLREVIFDEAGRANAVFVF